MTRRLPEHAAAAARTASDVARQLDAAGLAAAAGVHLRLDDPDRAAERLGGRLRLLGARGDPAGGHGDAVAGEHFLG